jgi:hypothetical protein
MCTASATGAASSCSSYGSSTARSMNRLARSYVAIRRRTIGRPARAYGPERLAGGHRPRASVTVAAAVTPRQVRGRRRRRTCHPRRMARTWLSVRVELLGGRGEELWPWPGRVFAVGPSHTFMDLANAINDAFARWDRSHLSAFTLSDGRVVTDEETGDEMAGSIGGPIRAPLDIESAKPRWPRSWSRGLSSSSRSTSATAGHIDA